MKQASWAEDILCCYPTLTYPCHVTISTGCWPDRHGICNNEKFQPLSKDRPEWYWFRKDIKTPTLIDYAKAAGLTTAAITWPVMGDCGADYTGRNGTGSERISKRLLSLTMQKQPG